MGLTSDVPFWIILTSSAELNHVGIAHKSYCNGLFWNNTSRAVQQVSRGAFLLFFCGVISSMRMSTSADVIYISCVVHKQRLHMVLLVLQGLCCEDFTLLEWLNVLRQLQS